MIKRLLCLIGVVLLCGCSGSESSAGCGRCRTVVEMSGVDDFGIDVAFKMEETVTVGVDGSALRRQSYSIESAAFQYSSGYTAYYGSDGSAYLKEDGGVWQPLGDGHTACLPVVNMSMLQDMKRIGSSAVGTVRLGDLLVMENVFSMVAGTEAHGDALMGVSCEFNGDILVSFDASVREPLGMEEDGRIDVFRVTMDWDYDSVVVEIPEELRQAAMHNN